MRITRCSSLACKLVVYSGSFGVKPRPLSILYCERDYLILEVPWYINAILASGAKVRAMVDFFIVPEGTSPGAPAAAIA